MIKYRIEVIVDFDQQTSIYLNKWISASVIKMQIF
ncbi:hypothetical protein HNR27_001855 [Ornithinibacillus bavariensis]